VHGNGCFSEGETMDLAAIHQLKKMEELMRKSKAMRVIGLALALVFTMGLGLVSAEQYCPDNFIGSSG
jgi:hypothetical protein